MKCNNCNNEQFITKPKGNSLGLYCSKCGKWVKWIKQSELRELERVNKIVDRASCETNNKYYSNKEIAKVKETNKTKSDIFKLEVFKLMVKYKLTISHEDTHGVFKIEPYNDMNVEWFLASEYKEW